MVKKLSSDNQIDVSGCFGVIMAPKASQELVIMKKSAAVTCQIYTKVYKDLIMRTIDKDKKLKHSKISDEIEQATESKEKSGVNPDNLDTAYPPIIQSGGKYALKFSAQSDENYLHFGTIVAMFGMKFKGYCSNIARCLMVNPTSQVEKAYEALVVLEDKLIELLKPGKTCSSVYNKVVEACPEKYKGELTRTFGSVIGIEFRDSILTIQGKCHTKIKKGMVFNISIGFQNVDNPEGNDSKSKKVALFLSDTIEVTAEGGPNVNLTALVKKRFKSCKISIVDNDSDSIDEEKEEEDLTNYGRGQRNADNKVSFREQEENDKKRREHQSKLLKQLNETALKRLVGGEEGKDSTTAAGKNTVSYDSQQLLPYQEADVSRSLIYIDRKRETIVLPVVAVPWPIHISMIKNVTPSVEGEYNYLRINFYSPGATLGRPEGANFTHPESTFVKELTFRSSTHGGAHTNLQSAVRLIRELQKRYRTRELEEKERKGLVKQDKLQINPNFRGARLKDLYMRPNLGQKRIPGILEAHTNGFRYQTVKQERVDILYSNVRHAIFQPCDHEMIMVVHFRLKNFILLNKRKVTDIQFYIEVGEITTDLMKGTNIRDRDDLYAEQREREMRHKLKTGFKNFIDRVESITKEVDFDTPFRDLGFFGAPHRSTCLMQPTSSCLINITEWPSFVVSLDDIECVHFERVSFSMKNFDMVILYKDYTKKVSTIGSIPMKQLDEIKNWLHSCDIRYTEGVQSLNWVKIMKTILDDVEGFFEQGGWDFLGEENGQSDEEDEELEKLEDGDFSGSDSESGSSDDSATTDSGEDSDDSDASDYSGEESGSGSDAEEGLDWDELEAQAKKADREKGEYEDDRPDDRKRKKTSSKSSPSKGKSSSSRSSAPPKKRRR